MYIKLFGPEVFGSALNDKKNPLDLCKRILFHTLVIFFPFQLKDYLGIIEKTGTANIWILILNSVAKKEFITIYFLAMESEIFVRMKFIRNCVLFSFVSFLLSNSFCTFNAFSYSSELKLTQHFCCWSYLFPSFPSARLIQIN